MKKHAILYRLVPTGIVMTAEPLVLAPPEPEVIHEGRVTIVGINDGERWELTIEDCRVTRDPEELIPCKGVISAETTEDTR